MRLTFLGTGTSTGVPQIGCDCEVCTSADVRDKRLRCSALVETGEKNLLIDCGPDFREQILREGSRHLDAVLLTHSHYDHVGGIDDLRPYCYATEHGFPIYCQSDVARNLHERIPYCFAKHPYPGVPTFSVHEVETGSPFDACGVDVMPVRVMHGRLPILGFRIGELGYITDCLKLPEESMELLRGVRVLVINSLRREPHLSHLSLEESLEVIAELKPERAYLTHLSHQMGRHAEVSAELPAGVEIAFDGLTVEI